MYGKFKDVTGEVVVGMITRSTALSTTLLTRNGHELVLSFLVKPASEEEYLEYLAQGVSNTSLNLQAAI